MRDEPLTRRVGMGEEDLIRLEIRARADLEWGVERMARSNLEEVLVKDLDKL